MNQTTSKMMNSTLRFELVAGQGKDKLSLLVELLKNNLLAQFHASITPFDLRAKDSQQRTLLHYACYFDKPAFALYLLLQGVDLNVLDNQHKSVFHICALKGSLACADILLAYQAHLRHKQLYDDFKNLLANYGLKKSNLKNGDLSVTANTPSKKQLFPEFQKQLVVIIEKHNKAEVADCASAVLTQDQTEKRTPVHLGCLNKYQKCYQTLSLLFKQEYPNYANFMEHWASCASLLAISDDPRIYTSVVQDAENGVSGPQLEVMHKKHRFALSKVFKEVNATIDKTGATPLHIASYNGFGNFVQLLIKLGAVPQKVDNLGKGQTKIIQLATTNSVRKHIQDLCGASQIGDKSSITLLVNCGQQVNQRSTIFGTTPLIKSVEFGSANHNVEATNLLIQSGADLNIQDTNGWTPLHKACELGNVQLVELILSKGASATKASNKGWTALHIAATHNHHEVITLLLDKGKGVNIETKDLDGCTALLLAAKKGHCKAVYTLLARKANLYAVDNRKWSALHYASFNQHRNTVTLLLKYDADKDHLRELQNSQGKIPKQMTSNTVIRNSFNNLWRCAFEGKLDQVRKLVMDHHDKDQRTIEKQRTPLMYAAMGGRFLVAKYLLEQGADTYAEDSEEHSAQYFAKEKLKQAKSGKDKNMISQAQKIIQLLQK